MLTDKKERSVLEPLLVHCVKSLFGIFGVLEADESAVPRFLGIFVDLNLSRLDLSVLSKHCSKSIVVSANWEVLDKEVGELVLRPVVHSAGRLGLVEENLKLFTTKRELLLVGFKARQGVSG